MLSFTGKSLIIWTIRNSSPQALATSKRWPRSGQVPLYTNYPLAIAEWSTITFVEYSKRHEPHNQSIFHSLNKAASAALNIQCTLPAAAPRLPTLRRVCHYCSAGLPSQCLIKLQFQDRLCIRIRRGHPLIMSGFR